MQSLKILIVEDEFIIASNLKLMLEDLGYEPYEPASNKKEAIKLLKEQEIDIAILDINLDGKHEGIEIGKFINENFHFPFIYLTSNSDKNTIDEAKQTHPNAYLIKPFTPEDIYAAIELAILSKGEKIKSENNDTQINLLNNSLFVKVGNKYCRVDINDIIYIVADGKLLDLHNLNGKKYSIRTSLDFIQNMLKQSGFIRIHRGFCININHLEAINGDFVFIASIQLPIGRHYKDELMDRLKILS